MKDQVQRSFVAIANGPNGGVVATYQFTADLPVFIGHFPNAPIVPGVFLIESVRSAIERHRAAQFSIVSVDEAKFLGPVLPGDSVEVCAHIVQEHSSIRCVADLRTGDAVVARIKLRLRDLVTSEAGP